MSESYSLIFLVRYTYLRVPDEIVGVPGRAKNVLNALENDTKAKILVSDMETKIETDKILVSEWPKSAQMALKFLCFFRKLFKYVQDFSCLPKQFL